MMHGKRHIKTIQALQNNNTKGNRKWYIRDDEIQKHLKIAVVDGKGDQHFGQKHDHTRLHKHTSVEMLKLLDNSVLARQLDSVKPL